MDDATRADRLINSLAAHLSPQQIHGIVARELAASLLETNRDLFNAHLLDAMSMLRYLLEVQQDVAMGDDKD